MTTKEQIRAGLEHLQEKFPILSYEAVYHLLDSIPDATASPALTDEIEAYWNNICEPDLEFGTSAKIDIKEFVKIAIHFAEWQKERMGKGVPVLKYSQAWFED